MIFSAYSCPTSLPLIQHSLLWALDLDTQLGLKFQLSKIIGPNMMVEFLGLKLDSPAMEVQLPQKKLAFLQDLLPRWADQLLAIHVPSHPHVTSLHLKLI